MASTLQDPDTNPSTAYLLTRIQRLEDEVSSLKAGIDIRAPRTLNEKPPSRPDVCCLPLKAWFRGPTAVLAPCQLTWDDGARLTIRSATHANTEEIDVAREARSINYTDPDDLRDYPVVAIVRNGQEQRQITLQLDWRHPDWSIERYLALGAWFKGQGENIDVFGCRSLVAETIWDTAARVTQRRVAAPRAEIPVFPPGTAVGVEWSVLSTKGGGGTPIGRVIPTLTPGSVVPLKNASASASALPSSSSSHPKIKLTGTVTTSLPPKRSPTNKPSDNNFLPIRAWYLGHKFFDEGYHLAWASNGKMTIRSGDAPGPAARHEEQLDMRMVAKTIWFVEPNERYQNKVFVLETYPKFRSTDKGIGAQFPLHFKQGAGAGPLSGMGKIMIKFNSASPAWADATYKAFVEWLKSKVDSRETLRGKAGDSKWEAASRIAQLSEARARRESGDGSASATPKAIPTTTKPSAVPGLPSINDWSPPARVAEPPWVSERQGSPSTPIEIELPPRPVPGPTYRGRDSVSVGGGLELISTSATLNGTKRRIEGENSNPKKKKRKT
ncbi:hypothetical protein FB451DRAFT_1376907 [Mycena latifolia]|nr:hypothetical protein FB451DRAFT_1376907 [Mycena latifolia]